MRVKTDKIDARVLADLLAANLIPAVWIGDERCRTLRRLVSRRRGLVKRRTQIRNEIAAALHRNLKGRNPASDPFGRKGRERIAAQQPPIDERLTVDACLRRWTSSPTSSRRSTKSSPSRRSETRTRAG
jgi:transposase